MMNEPEVQTLSVNGIRMRVAMQGSGPMVLMCHGFPESWVSWRALMQALAGAGYRAVAPDMRGYGGTDAPADPAQYTMLHLVGDLTELVRTLGETQAVVVGHDWGAPLAWHAALLRPEVFRAVVGMSAPYEPPGRLDLLSALEKGGITRFYMQHFQAPGVAEAELEADVAATLRRILFSMSGEGEAAWPSSLRLARASCTRRKTRRNCRPGSTPTTWPMWWRSFSARAFVAASTGTAPCGFHGS